MPEDGDRRDGMERMALLSGVMVYYSQNGVIQSLSSASVVNLNTSL